MKARCSTDISTESNWSESLSVTVSVEVVSLPATPAGSTNGIIGSIYNYSTGGAISNFSHSIEYRFDWGNGNYSSWSSSTNSPNSWSSPGTYNVRAQARCVNHNSAQSSWSNPLTVTINAVGPDLTGIWSIPINQTYRNTSKEKKYTIKGTLTVNNTGNKDASSTYVNFYISDNGTYAVGDIQLKSLATGKIKAGKNKAIKFSHNFQLGDTATGRYIIAVIDKDNKVTEIDETNNQIVYGPIH